MKKIHDGPEKRIFLNLFHENYQVEFIIYVMKF